MSRLASSWERPRSKRWCERLYRPPCWAPEPTPTASGDPFSGLAARFVPDVHRSYEAARRWEHADLPGLDDADLTRELGQARLLLLTLNTNDSRWPWVEGRAQAVTNEIRKRGRYGG